MCVEALHFFGLSAASVSSLTGGEKNRNWLIDDRHVLREYALADRDEVAFELAVIDSLVGQGFPTPRVAGAYLDGSRPAALFDYVVGRHPVGSERSLEIGCRVAALAGRMHRLLADVELPGRRSLRSDPVAMVERFVAGPGLAVPALADLLPALQRHLDRVRGIVTELPHGVVHNDMSIPNVLLAPGSDDVVALLDFDDCFVGCLVYDLGRVVETWGRRPDRRPDLARIDALVDAYAAERELTRLERRHAIDVIATYAAATGAVVLGNKIRDGVEIHDPRESHSMQLFLDLVESG